jgi:S1-C subfamily serine protease
LAIALESLGNQVLKKSLVKAIVLSLWVCLTQAQMPSDASENWERLDKRLKAEVFKLNVGLKIKLKNGSWAQLADLSPKYHYSVFGITKEDRGYRVVGFGSCFPIASTKLKTANQTYFVTNHHVIESGLDIAKEAERFFAALRLYSEQTAHGDVEARHEELLQTVNLSFKKDPMTTAERTLYSSTVDAIWDTYENFLSVKADPGRILFNKYVAQDKIEAPVGYFIHSPGPASQSPLEAKIYKTAKTETDPDLAILVVDGKHPGIEFDTTPPSEGQEVQVIGYPTASEEIDLDSSKYYAPTFNTGRISRVAPRMLQVDAPVTTGTSGGPVVNLRGKALGVVAVRAVSIKGNELPNFGGAISAQTVRSFAPELF